MIRIETETIIPASPEQIWDILTDFESYPEWNPMILEVTGKPVIGAKLKLKVSAPDNSGRKYSFKAVIVNNQPNEMLAWKGGVPEGISTPTHLDIFPIPASDLIANPRLKQNDDY